MQCGKCGTELLPGKAFCHACGAPSATLCTQCGREVQPGFRFCPDCGTEVAAAPPPAVANQPNQRLTRLASQVPREVADRMLAVGGAMAGERKRVTVLFCDLVGSTAIAEKLDPELYHDLLENYLALAFREIYHLDGFVNQLAGDGLMALFGAPIPHEDAPHRAVRAALAIRDALAAFNVQRRAEGSAELRIRIGINTGPVLVGAIGNDLKMDYSAIGDTTNVAARLQSLAEPGSILMSDDTHRLVRGFFAVRDAGRFEVKGKSEPLAVYEILGANDATSPMAIAAARGLTPFVGRDEELAQLMGCYERMTSRLAQVVSVVGEAGSGKSRVLYEFKQQLASRDAVLLEARCSSLTQMQPYAPWNSMIRMYCGITSRDPADVVCTKIERTLRAIDEKLLRIHPSLCSILGVEAKGVDVDSEELRRQTFGAMSDLFVALTHRAPTIMLIEDLHWMDDASREMIELAVTRIERGRLMVLVSHRPDFQPNWRTHAAFTQVYMRSLLDDTIDEIARAIVGGALPEELASLIRLKAEGNPFFAEEIARIVLEEGYVVRQDTGLELTRPVSELRMPGTVEEVLGARLDRLGPHAKRVTQVAAVLGRQFRKSQLVDLLAAEQIDVGVQLEELEQRGVFHRKTVLSDDEFRFGESLTQDVAYESLLLKERRQLHERVAQLLTAESGAPTAELSVLLAHHLGRSSNHKGAIEALLGAALAAERAPSYPTAAKLYRQAWDTASDVLGEGSDEEMSLLAVNSALGLLRMHVVYATADDPDAERAAVRGAALAEKLGESEKLALITTFHGLLVMGGERTRFHDGLAMVEQGIGIAQRNGLEQAAVGIARGLAFAYLYDGRFDESRRTIDSVLQGLQAANAQDTNSDVFLGTHFISGMIAFFSDDYALMEKDTVATYERAKSVSNRTVTSGASGLLAWMHLLRGDAAGAKRWADESLPIAEAIGNTSSVRTAAAVSLAARLRLGERVSPGRFIDAMEQSHSSRGDMASKAVLVVDTLIAIGEAKRAKRFAALAYGNAGGRMRESLAALGLAEALRAMGEDYWAEARRFYTTSLTLAEAIGSRSNIAAAALGSGLLALAEGRDGETLIRRSLDLSRELGLRLYIERGEKALSGQL